MRFKTPAFWYRSKKDPASVAEILLSPLSCFYGLGQKIHSGKSTAQKASIPVICAGNVVAGGGGKTPTLLALHALIKKYNIAQSPYFLSRGYGGKIAGPHRVTSGHDTVHDVGDEPLMLAKYAETLISRDRSLGVTSGHALGCDLILMDDGFQNNTVYKDLSFLVIDGAYGFGSGRLLPAGPLREPLDQAFDRADAVILIGQDSRDVLPLLPKGLPVFKAQRKSCYEGDKERSYIGFAGLAHPEKFRKTLEDEEIKLEAFHAFPDHYPYSDSDLETLIKEAEKVKSVLITTEKDYVRVPEKFKSSVTFFPIKIVFDDEELLGDFIKRHLGDAR